MKLNWEKDVKNVTVNIAKGIWVISQLRHYVDKHTVKLILSHIHYWIIGCGCAFKAALKLE